MAMIKGKQIQSVTAAKIVESSDKRFVTEAQITSYESKAETADVEAVKTEASKALADAKTAITGDIGTAKTEAVVAAKSYADTELLKANTKVDAVEVKVTTVEGIVTTELEKRYTKDEIDKKLSQLGAGIKYKGTVASYSEIATKFPNPEEGWLVAVEGTKKFYVYDADKAVWEEFPIDMSVNTTFVKTIRVVVVDGQTAIKTGIKTDGAGANQTSIGLAQEVVLSVNGFEQAKTIDYVVAVVSNEIEITWKSVEFALEASDVVSVTYNQTV